MAVPPSRTHATPGGGVPSQPDRTTAAEHRDLPAAHTAGIGCLQLVQGVPVVHLLGELDLLTRPQLQDLLSRAVRRSPLRLVIDTAAVTFIDCSGLGALLCAAADLRQRQGRLRMVRPSAAVLRLAALTGTSDLLKLGRAPHIEHR